jgi:hypothetical protein
MQVRQRLVVAYQQDLLLLIPDHRVSRGYQRRDKWSHTVSEKPSLNNKNNI